MYMKSTYKGVKCDYTNVYYSVLIFIIASVMGYARPSGKKRTVFVFIRDHNLILIVSIEFSWENLITYNNC